LLDRLDIRLTVPRLSKAELMGSSSGEASSAIRARVEAARERQRARLRGTPFGANAAMPGSVARRHAHLTSEAEKVLGSAVDRLGLSGRGFDRALKVARTIADLEGADRVGGDHLYEALRFRGTDREGAGAA
jgi:magnesium chelatase family protein